MKRTGKFPKAYSVGINYKVDDRIWVEEKEGSIRARITEISDNEKGGTEIYWEEL